MSAGVSQEWISVKDRLPERDTPVLVWFRGKAFHGRKIDIGSLSEEGEWTDDARCHGSDGYLCYVEVTHWQPLPGRSPTPQPPAPKTQAIDRG